MDDEQNRTSSDDPRVTQEPSDTSDSGTQAHSDDEHGTQEDADRSKQRPGAGDTSTAVGPAGEEKPVSLEGGESALGQLRGTEGDDDSDDDSN